MQRPRVAALSLLLAACGRETPRRPPPPPPRAVDASARDAAPPVAPAILEAARLAAGGAPGDVPPPPGDGAAVGDVTVTTATLSEGAAERVTTAADGSRVRVAASNFVMEAAITRAPNASTATLALAFRGAGGTAVNDGYPITIELSAEGVEIAKASLRRADGRPYTRQLARFETALRDAARGERVRVETLFSVCRGADCAFESRTVTVAVP